jgi:hypothetical protein
VTLNVSVSQQLGRTAQTTVIVASGTHSSSSLKANHSPTLSGHSPAVLPPADFSFAPGWPRSRPMRQSPDVFKK